MKRNLYLIRKMMQVLEQDERLDGRSVYLCYASQLFEFPEHNEKELAYNLMLIIDEGWMDAEYVTASGSFLFRRLTAEGHDFIDSGDPCQIRAYGEWAPDFYVKRLISVRRIDDKALNEMPEEYRGNWTLYRGDRDDVQSNKEAKMPVGTKGIGWRNAPCSVTALDRNATPTTVVKQMCGGREVTELWSLRK
jgi:hypothetical protein